MARLIPSNITATPMKFFKDEGVMAVLGASLFGAMAQRIVAQYALKNPVLGRNVAIGMFVGGVILFILANKFVPSGFLRLMATGAAASVGLAGVLPFLQQIIPARLLQ